MVVTSFQLPYVLDAESILSICLWEIPNALSLTATVAPLYLETLDHDNEMSKGSSC